MIINNTDQSPSMLYYQKSRKLILAHRTFKQQRVMLEQVNIAKPFQNFVRVAL